MSLESIFGAKTPIWQLGMDGFIKFQLKRKMLNQDGTNAFMKQATKLLKDVPSLNQDIFDTVAAASLSYCRDEMQTNEVFREYEEEARSVVYTDLVQAFQRLGMEILSGAQAEAGG